MLINDKGGLVLSLPRLLLADFHNYALHGMHDGFQHVAESTATLLALREAGVCRVLLTPTYRASVTSIRRFCQRRNQAWRQLRSALPHGMTVHLSALLVLEPDCCSSPDLHKLMLSGDRYLPVELPLGAFADWVDFELHMLLHRRSCRPIFVRFERAALLYPEEITARLTTVPGAAYQFSLAAAAASQFTPLIKSLLHKGKPVLLGTGVNRPTQDFSSLHAQLDAICRQLGRDAYNSLLCGSYAFGPFGSFNG